MQKGKGHGMRYCLNRKLNEGGQVRGQAESTPDITLNDWQLLQALLEGDKSAKELKALHSNRSNVSGAFKERIAYLMENRLIEFTIPDKPKSSKQKYRLTSLGQQIVKERNR